MDDRIITNRTGVWVNLECNVTNLHQWFTHFITPSLVSPRWIGSYITQNWLSLVRAWLSVGLSYSATAFTWSTLQKDGGDELYITKDCNVNLAVCLVFILYYMFYPLHSQVKKKVQDIWTGPEEMSLVLCRNAESRVISTFHCPLFLGREGLWSEHA